MKLGKAWIRSLDLENAYAAAMSAAPTRAGIEISRHALSPALESYAPYFGMRVPKVSADTPQTMAASDAPPINGANSQAQRDTGVDKSSPVEAAATAEEATPSPATPPKAPSSPAIHAPPAGADIHPRGTSLDIPGKTEVQTEATDTKEARSGTSSQDAEKLGPIVLISSPKQLISKSTRSESVPADANSDPMDGTVEALIKQFPTFASLTKKEAKELINFVRGRLQGGNIAQSAMVPTASAHSQSESSGQTKEEATSGWQLSGESLPMTRTDAVMSHQRHAWAQSVKSEDAKANVQKDASGQAGPKIVVNLPKIVEIQKSAQISSGARHPVKTEPAQLPRAADIKW